MTTETAADCPVLQTIAVRRFARAMPLAVTLLIWLFAASLETGYVAVLNAGIQSSSQVGETV